MNLNMLEQLYLLAGFGNTVFPDEMEQGARRGRFEFLCLDRWMDGRGFYKVYFVCPSVPNNLVTKSVVNQRQGFAILICSRCSDRGSAVETICASSFLNCNHFAAER